MQQNVCILLILCILVCLLAGCRQTTTAPTDQSITAATTGSSTSHPTRTDSHPKTSITVIPTTSKTTKQYQNNCRLTVRGVDISTEHYVNLTIIDEYTWRAELPMIAISQGIGAKTHWLSDTREEVTYRDNTIVFDEETSDFGLPPIYPGNIVIRKLVDGEMIVDKASLVWFLECWGWRIDVHYETKTIEVRVLTSEERENLQLLYPDIF